MKLRKYEKRKGILFLIIIFFISLFGLVIFTISYKISSYYLITGVVCKDDLLEILITTDRMDTLYKNDYVYINNRKHKYYIRDVVLNALEKDEKNYNIVYVECKLNDEKENDIVELVFMEDKVKLFEIFGVIWKGD